MTRYGDVRILDDDVDFWFLKNEVEEFYSYRSFLWMWISPMSFFFFQNLSVETMGYNVSSTSQFLDCLILNTQELSFTQQWYLNSGL